MNRREAFIVDKIDRDAEWVVEQGRVALEAEELVGGYVASFTLPEEQVVALVALAREVTRRLVRFGGASWVVRLITGQAGRAEKLPVARFVGVRR